MSDASRSTPSHPSFNKGRWAPLTTSRRWFYEHRTFISYRTAEHKQYVETVASVLEDAKFDVWLDQRQRIPSWMGLGLDFHIKRGLAHSDTLLYLVASGSDKRIPLRATIKDHLDFWFVAFLMYCGLTPGFWYGMWYRLLYGTSIIRSPFALLLSKPGSWQQYELRVSQELGLHIIRVVLLDDEEDREAPPEDTIVLRVSHLEDDIRTAILPRLEATRRAPAQHKQDAWNLTCLSLISVGFAAGVFCTAALGLILFILWLLISLLVGALS